MTEPVRIVQRRRYTSRAWHFIDRHGSDDVRRAWLLGSILRDMCRLVQPWVVRDWGPS